MKFTNRRSVLGMLLLGSASTTYFAKPSVALADDLPPIDLSGMVPPAFGDWRQQPSSVQIINPQAQEMLDQLYSQTLSRTYANSQGYGIMLSIAYGKVQSGSLQLHRPDVCYAAQGFTLHSRQAGTLALGNATIPAMRFATSLKQRKEPVTFWMVVGEYVALTRSDQKLAEIRYAFRNRVADGMLVRVSSIDSDKAAAFALQEQFSAQLVAALAGDVRARFAGRTSLPAVA